MRRYNAEVIRGSLILVMLLASVACNRVNQSHDSVRQGIVEHLGKGSGLDLSLMDVNVTNVKFEGEKAHAAVSFKPKSAPDQGMQMNYDLEWKNAKWVVVGKAGMSGGGGHGNGAEAPSSGSESGALPPGHPPVQPPPSQPK